MIVRRLSVVGVGVETIQAKENENGASQEQQLPSSPPLLGCNRSSLSARDECLLLMVICNTVQVETDADGAIKYLFTFTWGVI
jgi:hypothetical protein